LNSWACLLLVPFLLTWLSDSWLYQLVIYLRSASADMAIDSWAVINRYLSE
uniref:Uncharacterized protein n=1 Tax=Aegilops tauschii subsp. strangulata TaxID=200361 RepID=A0A453TDK8_AEGTS